MSVLPRSIDYGAHLPVGVPAIQRRRRFYPTTGATFGPGQIEEIRIDLESANQLLDPANSYLDFEVVNNDIAQSVGFDCSDQVFFDTIRIEQGGRVLSRVTGYNRLNCTALSMCQTNHNGRVSESVTGGQRGGAAGAIPASVNPIPPGGGLGASKVNLQHNSSADLGPVPAAGPRFWKFSVPIQTGLFTQDKLIPLPLLKPGAPLTICLELTASENIGCWTAAPAPLVNAYSIRNVSYVGSMVEVGRDVMDQIRGVQDRMGGQLVISSQDWEHATANIAGGGVTTGEQIMRIPARHRSIKSVLWFAQSDSVANCPGIATIASTYNMSYSGTMNGISYQLKVGGMVYPPTSVNMSGQTGAANEPMRRGEMCMELAKAFGTLGWTKPTGQLNTFGYASGVQGLGDGDNGNGGVQNIGDSATPIAGFVAGLDLDAWQRTAIEGGVDNETLAEEANLIVTIDPATNAGAEDKTLHMYVLFDKHYYFNRDGMITFSD